MVRPFFIFVVVILNFFSVRVKADEAIRLIEAEELLLIGKQISYLEDASGELGISDVLQPGNQGRFIKQEKDVFNRPGTPSAFWFKITTQNHCLEDAWLEVGSTYAWYIDFYAPDTLGHYHTVIETGTMHPDNSKLYDVNFFWLPLNKANDTISKTYYVRIVSGLTFELPLQIGTIRSLSKKKDINDFLTAGFIGILMVMLLYNAFIYLSTKDHIYVFYLGYLLIMAISMPYANGYPFIEKLDFLFFNKALWNNYFIIWHAPVYFFIGTFCIRYLDLAKNGPKVRRLIQIEMLIISGVFPLLNLVGFQFIQLVNAVQVFILLLYLTCLISGFYYTFKRIKQAYFYILGWTFMVAGAFIFFAVINGFLPFNPFTRNTLYFGVAVEVWLFSLALGNRLNVLQKEKDRIKSENLKLIKDQNEVLERNVRYRTEELEASNEELMQTNEELMVTTEQLDQQSHQLRDLNNTKDQLFAIIGHDLRSPINSLKGLMNLMWGHNISTEEFFHFSKSIKHGVEHAHFTLNNLLNWAKSQMEGMTTKPKAFVLNAVVLENQSLVQEPSQNKNIEVVIDMDSAIEVYADPDHVNLIIRNLLSNALKFTDKGGMVKLSAVIKNTNCEIAIADTGIGMSVQSIEDLFKNNSNDSQLGTDGEKGTGLGLVLCRDFIEKNGGKIWVESKEGEGATFYFTLPLYATTSE